MSSASIPWYVYPILLKPRRIAAGLQRVEQAGVVAQTPNLWQMSQGVLRMLHRVTFRSETVGTCQDFPVRRTWRARLLRFRPLRLPFLLAEGAVVPLDLTGLASSPETLIRHLLAAHHDRNQFVFDLELLALHPGRLEELARETRRLLEEQGPRFEWLRDLAVFERYHETLAEAVERVLERGIELTPRERHDPDLSFRAYLDWCAARPRTPLGTLREWLQVQPQRPVAAGERQPHPEVAAGSPLVGSGA